MLFNREDKHMLNNIAIELTRVTKKYRLYTSKRQRLIAALFTSKKSNLKDFFAVRDIDLKINKGEIIGVVGKNGSGKSTLMKLVAGVVTPTSGTVYTSGNIMPLLELGSGFHPEFTGLENIYFYSALHGYWRKDTDKIVKEILEFADIGEFINQPYKNYSSGMKARLSFAVAVNIDPDILILDEVLSVGDAAFKEKSAARMKEFFAKGKTILFVSHALPSIVELCTRAILVDKGEIIMDGPPEQVTKSYAKLVSVNSNYQEVREEILKSQTLKASNAIPQ
jgi:lipopolysaccharide transport system ATP-binding protein